MCVIVHLPCGLSGQATLTGQRAYLGSIHRKGLGLNTRLMTCVSRRRGRCSCLLSTVEHQSHQAMAITCILLCLTLIVQHTMSAPLPDPPPHADTELDAAVTPGQEGPLGANSPNLNYCCGPSGYCKPCKDQTQPVGGPIDYPAWISQMYGK